ncbi:MAG TPA: PQQ-binding-like beta-propeller repeat protein [Prolixibacteraceae bacterium]|nr:PQQ-binding-like beta-propeller repeat protein [Prolixibacteraceae bacterium]
MKRFKLLTLLLFVAAAVFAQEDMPVVWETKLSHQILHTGTSLEGKHSYAASDKEMTLFDNENGKTIWTKSFDDIAPKLRKIDELIPFWESRTIFLFDRKTGKDQIACIALETGKLLWTSEKYQDLDESSITYIKEEDSFAVTLKNELVYIRAQTGEELWVTAKFKGVVGQYSYDPNDQTMVMVNFVPSALGALFSGFKNQIVRMNMKNGEILWENTYIGRAERKIISKKFLFSLDVTENKVFLRLNGMQVYDYKTGTQLWSAAFDFTPEKVVGKPVGVRSFGVYGAVASPVVDGNDIYVLDMVSKSKQYVKKYDINTGKLLWTSHEIDDARAIPGMAVIDGKVLLQIGGIVEKQYIQVRRTPDKVITEYIIEFENVKPCGIQALNTSDGKLVWESERFKKGITNAIALNGDYIVCSGKELYSLDIASGKEKYEVPVSKGGVGLAQGILPFKDNVIVVVGEKGVSTFNITDGALLNSGKYRTSSLEDRVGEILVMKTDKADIGTFDLNTCKYMDFKARTGAVTTLSRDGDFVYVYEKKVVTKLRTRG